MNKAVQNIEGFTSNRLGGQTHMLALDREYTATEVSGGEVEDTG